MNYAVEEGELWQFLKLNRKTAVRYRENPDGSYEILEENFKFFSSTVLIRFGKMNGP